ncbi:hypothetical protein ABPG72_007290 [Tetrahymena utriculariae]
MNIQQSSEIYDKLEELKILSEKKINSDYKNLIQKHNISNAQNIISFFDEITSQTKGISFNAILAGTISATMVVTTEKLSKNVVDKAIKKDFEKLEIGDSTNNIVLLLNDIKKYVSQDDKNYNLKYLKESQLDRVQDGYGKAKQMGFGFDYEIIKNGEQIILEIEAGIPLSHSSIDNIPKDKIKDIINQIKDIKEILKQNNYVHQDIKLQNIAIDKNLKVNLIDLEFTKECKGLRDVFSSENLSQSDLQLYNQYQDIPLKPTTYDKGFQNVLKSLEEKGKSPYTQINIFFQNNYYDQSEDKDDEENRRS